MSAKAAQTMAKLECHISGVRVEAYRKVEDSIKSVPLAPRKPQHTLNSPRVSDLPEQHQQMSAITFMPYLGTDCHRISILGGPHSGEPPESPDRLKQPEALFASNPAGGGNDLRFAAQRWNALRVSCLYQKSCICINFRSCR